jgi:hypothetical protein
VEAWKWNLTMHVQRLNPHEKDINLCRIEIQCDRTAKSDLVESLWKRFILDNIYATRIGACFGTELYGGVPISTHLSTQPPEHNKYRKLFKKIQQRHLGKDSRISLYYHVLSARY